MSNAVHHHLVLNGDKIVKMYRGSNPVGIETITRNLSVEWTIDSDLSIVILNTGEEFIIPKIMIFCLKNMRLDGSIDTKNLDRYDSLLIILHKVANMKNENEETIINLLRLIKDNNLESKDFKFEIYDSLGVIASHILYYSIDDFNFY